MLSLSIVCRGWWKKVSNVGLADDRHSSNLFEALVSRRAEVYYCNTRACGVTVLCASEY